MEQGKLDVHRRFPFEAVLLAALAVWSVLPLALLLGGPGVFNGSDGLQIGDHMQYLAFIRDSGEHLLLSNRFDVVPDPHLFLHPMYVLSGLAWRAGASLQLAFLAWKPVCVLLLFVGFAAYVRRLLAPDRGAMAVALTLALFYVAPAMWLADWLGASPAFRFGTGIVGLEMYVADYTWGASSGTLAVALMPLFLLAIERALDPAGAGLGGSRWRYPLLAGAAGLLCTWLHPWQGLTLLAILGGLVVWDRLDRRNLVLAVPAALTAAPLVYFWALSHTHSSWSFVSRPNHLGHVRDWFVVGLAPALLALPGYRGLREGLDVQERIVRLWPVAGLAVYFALHGTWIYHALVGLSLPLAVLAVKGLRGLAMPRFAVVTVVAALTVPGLVFSIQALLRTRGEHFFTGGESRALQYLDRARRPGPVLAPRTPLAQAIPAFTGRRTYVGHYNWTPDYTAREARTDALFAGRLPSAQAIRLVRESRAAFLASDCRRRADLVRLLRPILVRVHRFGCATVYEVRASGLQAQITPTSPAGTVTAVS